MSGTIRIHGVEYPVDVRAEIEDFDWTRANWSDPHRLQACSPFRYDRNPSFFVDLREDSEYYGCWSDSNADDPEWRSGGFTKLLAFLRNETREETEYYLITKYGADPSEDIVKLRPKKLRLRAESDGRKSLTLGEYYSEQCEYIHKRGIAPDVAEMMRIGYDSRRKAAVIPWFNADGTVGNVKYRRVDSKVFWYERGGRPIRDMVYGIDVIYRRRIRKACVVEAEIDAMTLMSAGMACVATGGATFTEDKRRLIVQSPLEEIVIVRDNDRAGRRWRNDIYEALRKDVRISFATVPLAAKDPNEYAQAYGVEALRAKMLRRLRHIATLSGVLGDKM